MSEIEYKIYECDNPACGLRFPGQDGFPRWKLCPACRSAVHVVAQAKNSPVIGVVDGAYTGWRMEALLDNLRSAWNVGSIFRTAEGMGIQKLHLCGISPTPDNPKVYKTSLGAETTVPWEKSSNGVTTAAKLKSGGYKIWALEYVPGAVPLFEVETSLQDLPVLLVVGNETSGVDPGIIGLCDQLIMIPMAGKKRSYNVAIAFSMAVSYLFYRWYVTSKVIPTDPLKYSPESG